MFFFEFYYYCLMISKFLINNRSILQPLATILASIIAPSIALLGVVSTIKNSSENNRKSMITSTITKERAAWLNRLRDSFAEFNGYTYQVMRLRYYISGEELHKAKEFNELVTNMKKTQSYITLLLNPQELPPQTLFKNMENCINNLTRITMNDDFFNVKNNLEYIQQVILKAEWYRINQEAEGKKENMEIVYEQVSIEIDPELAEEILGYTPKEY
ncbi:hypothetical protein [Bacillus pumilus]|uniref:hypothetical protein n=1 Tax=Bacillus pumilus TaxID=1408 RepID=UPI0037EF7075|nr:hypothetical protein [Bacillus pumilus]